MTLSCYDVTHSLGVYLVGAVDTHERAAIDAHLAFCPACRDELASLAVLPGLMSRVTVDEVLAGPPAMDGGMLERLLGAAARERRVARQRRWLSAAAAVVVLAGGSVGGVAAYDAATAPDWPVVAASAGPVHMSVKLESESTGTALVLHLSGVPAEQRCRLIAVSDTGAQEVAGWWEATYAGTAVIRGTTSIGYKHLSQLIIETDSGKQLVSKQIH